MSELHQKPLMKIHPQSQTDLLRQESRSKKKKARNFSSPKNMQNRSPLAYKFIMQSMLIYWRENYKGIFDRKGFSLRQNEELEKEEKTLEYFGAFAEGLRRTRHLERLDLSGTDIHPYLLMEIAQSLMVNRSIHVLNLSGSTLSSFMLSYLFKRLIYNRTIQTLKISNNQNLGIEAIQDLVKLLMHKSGAKNQISALDVSHCNIECIALALLCSSFGYSNTIVSINLSIMMFPPVALLALARALSRNTSIQSLNISYNHIGTMGFATFVNNLSFWGVKNIVVLNIAGNLIQSDALIGKLFTKLYACKEVDLSFNKLTSIKNIYNKRLNEHLEVLRLRGNSIEEIPEEMFSNLRVLDLSNNRIKFKGANQIARKLRQVPNPKWTTLHLDSNYIESEGFNDIVYALRYNTILRSLSIAYNQLDGESMICMIVNYDSLSLEELDISGNKIHYSIVFVFLKEMKQFKLRKLTFCDLDNDSLAVGAPHETKFVLNCESLQELNFSGNESIACSVVCSLQARYNNLEILNLKGCAPFHDQDLVCLANYIKKSESLRSLNLRGLSIGTLELTSIEYFCNVLRQNNRLQVLDISKNRLAQRKETLMILLPSLGKSSNLTTLDLSANRITQKHRFWLQSMLIKSKSLQSLCLSNNLISLESVLKINIDDSWELFFRNAAIQKLRKTAHLITKTSNVFNSNNNYINLSGGYMDLQQQHQDTAFAEKIAEAKREFLKEYKESLKRRMLSAQQSWILRVGVRNLDVKNLNLRADDLRIVGDILAGGCMLSELNLANNLDFGKANLVAHNLHSLKERDSLSLSNQTFRDQVNFGFVQLTQPLLQPSQPSQQQQQQQQQQMHYNQQFQKQQSQLHQQQQANQQQQYSGALYHNPVTTQNQLQSNLHASVNGSALNNAPSSMNQYHLNQNNCGVGGASGAAAAAAHGVGGGGASLQQILLTRCVFDEVSSTNFCSGLQQASGLTHSLKVFHAQNVIMPMRIWRELIGVLSRCESLQVLKLRHVYFDDAFCARISSLLSGSSSLKMLDLSRNVFSDAQFEPILAGIAANRSIQNCIFEQMKISMESFAKLFDALKMSSTLKLLDLAGNSFSAPALHALGMLVQASTKLKFLNLPMHRNYATFSAASALNHGKQQSQNQRSNNLNPSSKVGGVFEQHLSAQALHDGDEDDDDDDDDEEEENNEDDDDYGSDKDVQDQNNRSGEMEGAQQNADKSPLPLSSKDEEEFKGEQDHRDFSVQMQMQLQQGKRNLFESPINVGGDGIGSGGVISKQLLEQASQQQQQQQSQSKQKHLGTPGGKRVGGQRSAKISRKGTGRIEGKQENKGGAANRGKSKKAKATKKDQQMYLIEVEAFTVFVKLACAKNPLRHLDLSSCGLTDGHLAILVDTITTSECYLKSLNIPKNHFVDENGVLLKRLLVSNTCLQELNLRGCSISPTAYPAICEGLVEGVGLKCLDMSENIEGDVFCRELMKMSTVRAEGCKLRFLFLEKCGVTGEGNECVKQVLRNSSQSLFVWNLWTNVDSELACLILRSYERVFKQETFIRGFTPWYLKRVSITDSLIDDAFCMQIASEAHEFSFFESIDLSSNPRITSIGKISLFLQLFDIRYDNSQLNTFYIHNNQPHVDKNIAHCLPDLGILGFLAHAINNFQTKLGFLQRINAYVLSNKYFIPTVFQLNIYIKTKLERKQKPKIVFAFLVLHFLTLLLQYVPVPLILRGVIEINNYSSDRTFQIIIPFFAFVLALIELAGVCVTRLQSTLLMEGDQLQASYWKSLVNKREVTFAIISFLERCDGYTDSFLVGLFMNMGHSVLQYITVLFILAKVMRKIVLMIVQCVRWNRVDGKEEMSAYLQNLWKLCVSQGFYVAENFLNKFSPTDSVRLLKSEKRLNYKTMSSGYTLFFESLPFFVLYIMYFTLLTANNLNGEDSMASSVTSTITVISFIKVLMQSIHFALSFLLYKPSQIGQTQFDEALITLHYMKALDRLNQGKKGNTKSILPGGMNIDRYTNLRSLLVPKNPLEEKHSHTIRASLHEQRNTNTYLSSGVTQGLDRIDSASTPFMEKYSEGFAKKNKYTFISQQMHLAAAGAAGLNGEYLAEGEHDGVYLPEDIAVPDEQADTIAYDQDESFCVPSIIEDEQGTAKNLPNYFDPKQTKFNMTSATALLKAPHHIQR